MMPKPANISAMTCTLKAANGSCTIGQPTTASFSKDPFPIFKTIVESMDMPSPRPLINVLLLSVLDLMMNVT